MYKTVSAVILNCIFGVCLAYDLAALELTKTIHVYGDILEGLRWFIIQLIWVVLFFKYNISRFKKGGGGKRYWLSLLIPFLSVSIVIKLCVVFL